MDPDGHPSTSSTVIDLCGDDFECLSLVKKEEDKDDKSGLIPSSLLRSTIPRKAARMLTHEQRTALDTVRFKLEEIRSAEHYKIEDVQIINENNISVLQSGIQEADRITQILERRKGVLKRLGDYRQCLDETQDAMLYASDEERAEMIHRAQSWVEEKAAQISSSSPHIDELLKWKAPQKEERSDQGDSSTEQLEEMESREARLEFEKQVLLRDQEQYKRDHDTMQERTRIVSMRETSLAKEKATLATREAHLDGERSRLTRWQAELRMDAATLVNEKKAFEKEKRSIEEIGDVVIMMKNHLKKLMLPDGEDFEKARDSHVDHLRRLYRYKFISVDDDEPRDILAKYGNAMELSIKTLIDMDNIIEKQRVEKEEMATALLKSTATKKALVDAASATDDLIEATSGKRPSVIIEYDLKEEQFDDAVGPEWGESASYTSDATLTQTSTSRNGTVIGKCRCQERGREDFDSGLGKSNSSDGDAIKTKSSLMDESALQEVATRAVNEVIRFEEKEEARVKDRKADAERKRDAALARVVKDHSARAPYFSAIIMEDKRRRPSDVNTNYSVARSKRGRSR